MNDYVDKFVITEGDMTFSGLPKESHFLNNKERFAKWEDKIILNQINIPECESPWHREIYSRNAMVNLDIFNDDDLIIMSDGDEIPNPEILEQASESIRNGDLEFLENKFNQSKKIRKEIEDIGQAGSFDPTEKKN